MFIITSVLTKWGIVFSPLIRSGAVKCRINKLLLHGKGRTTSMGLFLRNMTMVLMSVLLVVFWVVIFRLFAGSLESQLSHLLAGATVFVCLDPRTLKPGPTIMSI